MVDLGMIEEWREVPGHPRYDVSNLGRIRSRPPNGGAPRALKQTTNHFGYKVVSLSSAPGIRKQWGVHQVVCLAFIGPREAGKMVRHLDGSRDNNALSNLTYGTALENSMDTIAHGRTARGEAHPRAKLTEHDVGIIRSAIERGVPTEAIALTYDINRTVIHKIKHKEAWSWLDTAV